MIRFDFTCYLGLTWSNVCLPEFLRGSVWYCSIPRARLGLPDPNVYLPESLTKNYDTHFQVLTVDKSSYKYFIYIVRSVRPKARWSDVAKNVIGILRGRRHL